MSLHQVTLAEIGGGLGDDERSALAQAIDGDATVGAPDDGLFDVAVEADSREDALAKVRDAIAAIGIEERVTFSSTTGTDFVANGHRAAAPDERPDDDEPPHLQGGSPHEDVPAPYDPPSPDVP
jgi:hypothetical protein